MVRQQAENIVPDPLSPQQAEDLLDLVDVIRDPIHGDVRLTALERHPNRLARISTSSRHQSVGHDLCCLPRGSPQQVHAFDRHVACLFPDADYM